jgi:photosystem II stability/assembly factor-like uncharacterized protein
VKTGTLDWQKTGELSSAEGVYSLGKGLDGSLYAGTFCAEEDSLFIGRVFKSTDGGVSWTNTGELQNAVWVSSFLHTSGAIYAGALCIEDTLLVGRVFKSVDGGATWIATSGLEDVGGKAWWVSSIMQSSDGALYAGTLPGRVFKSVDGGTTWDTLGMVGEGTWLVHSLLQTTDEALYAGVQGDEDTLVVGKVFKSTDSGVTWDSTGNLQGATDVTSLLQTSDGAIYVGAVCWDPPDPRTFGRVFKSINGGTTWTKIGEFKETAGVHSLLQSAGDTLFAGTGRYKGVLDVGRVFKSPDGGATWINMGELEETEVVYTLIQASNGNIYAGTGPNGDVFRYSPVGISEKAQQKAENYHLSQNIPNPAKTRTQIEYQIPNGAPVFVSLKIYSISGNLVRTLMASEKDAGLYRVAWDGHDDNGNKVTAGVYFYRLEAGEYKAMKKMVILR